MDTSASDWSSRSVWSSLFESEMVLSRRVGYRLMSGADGFVATVPRWSGDLIGDGESPRAMEGSRAALFGPGVTGDTSGRLCLVTTALGVAT